MAAVDSIGFFAIRAAGSRRSVAGKADMRPPAVDFNRGGLRLQYIQGLAGLCTV
jgi:hypothetical protein